MSQSKYRIYELSARAVMSYAVQRDERWLFAIDHASTEKCKKFSALHEQDGSALFFQIMCVLQGDDFSEPTDDRLITDLADVIFYMDFSGIFDRGGTRQSLRQEKARDMFRPEGVCLDFGFGAHRYLAFERSGNMSRQATLSFLREDVYEQVRHRIQMDMTIGDCQLSKLYAYNGLMLSGGVRVDGIRIDKPHRVIVVDNPTVMTKDVPVITVEDDGTQNSTRKYHRVERRTDIPITCFDGEGLISKQYAKVVDRAFCGAVVHTSFQIRLPYVKGMLHQVDFHEILDLCGQKTITDIWGEKHKVQDVDIILTKSMFKGFGWLKSNNMTWSDYWNAFRRYRHALYITNVSKETPETHTELNYQFLNTVSIREEEFRPRDLPDGWNHSPEEDKRNWLTKQTEVAYYNFRANAAFQQEYFLRRMNRWDILNRRKSREHLLGKILNKNPLIIGEPIYQNELNAKAKQILKNYAVGRLIVAGDNRYLSGDLMDFLSFLLETLPKKKRNKAYYEITRSFRFATSAFYAPGAAYDHGGTCTLLRNPHIARNEELQLSFYDAKREKLQMRHFYFRHLTDIVMVDSTMLAAERLGGADYDGDMIKTIADPILNECVRRNYEVLRQTESDALSNEANIPLLMIPAAEPLVRNADDWEARFETVRGTFSSRVGQICNAALDRSVIAYNENSNDQERRRYREETELLAILTGLEIDSAKSGVRPDLDEYLNERKVERTPFLQYKNLVERSETRRAWYEPTHHQRLNAFFEKVDWNRVDSNLERLPYLAWQLEKHTPSVKSKPVEDSKLFTFAQAPDWKEQLDKEVLSRISALLTDYEACLSRIRACRAPIRSKRRKNDMERILYSRGQEDIWDTDELYALLGTLPPEQVSEVLEALRQEQWQFLDEEARERFLLTWLPEFESLFDLLADFRCSGYRILGDLLRDIYEENTSQDRKQLTRPGDSPAFAAMMQSYLGKRSSQSYREAVSAKCRELLNGIIKPVVAVRYVVALGKRSLLWELLMDAIEPNVLEVYSVK